MYKRVMNLFVFIFDYRDVGMVIAHIIYGLDDDRLCRSMFFDMLRIWFLFCGGFVMSFSKTRSHDVKHAGKDLAPVDVLNPENEDELIEMVADGIVDWPEVCKHFHSGLTVKLQADRRRESSLKTMPTSTYDRIYNELTNKQHEEIRKQPNSGLALRTLINQVWRAELDATRAEVAEDVEDES